MGAPWEKYQTQTAQAAPADGPWAKYAAAKPEPYSSNPDFPMIRGMADKADIPKRVQEDNVARELGLDPAVARGTAANAKFTQGTTFGFADEIVGGIVAAGTPIANIFRDEKKKVGDTYEEVRDKQRALNTYAETVAPKTALALEVGGGFATGGLAGGAKVTGAKTATGAAAQGAKVGAIGGGLYGVGSAEGGVANRVEGSLKGAAIGGLTGAAIGPVALVFSGLANKIKIGGPKVKMEKAERILLREVMKQNKMSADEAMKAITSASADDPALMFQKLGLQEFGKGTAAKGGRAQGIFEDAIREQQRGQQARISKGVKEIIDASDFSSLKSDIGEKLASEGAGLYTKAFSQPFQPSQKLAQLMQRPSMKRAMARASRFAADAGTELQGNELQYFQHVKEGLDDMIGASVRQGKGSQTRSLMTLKTELLDELDAAVPDYKAARQLWAGQKANETALEYGRKSLTMRAEDIAQDVAGYSQSERQHMLAGVLQAVDDKLKTASLSHDATTRFNSEKVRDVFRTVLPEEQANRITELLDAESLLTATGRTVRPSFGSQTAPKIEAAARVERATQGPIRKGLSLAAEHGATPIQSAKRYLQVVASRVTKEDPAVIEALAVRLAGTPQEAAEAYARLSPLGQKSAQRVYTAAGGQGSFIAGESSVILQQGLTQPSQPQAVQ